MKRKKRKISELSVPKGYELEDLYDTDDSEFAGEEPVLIEEVRLNFERDDDRKERRV